MVLGAKLSRAIVLLNLLCLLEPPPPVSGTLKTFDMQYQYFESNFDYSKVFEKVSSANIGNNAFQVTPDSVNSGYTLTYKSGRVLYKFPFKLWEGRNYNYADRVGSFNTSFLVNLNRVNNSTAAPGEGLTFVVAPDLNIPQNSSGEYLGLTNSTTDTNSTNQFIAVELDTFKQDFDPDSNHVGLNINTVRSYNTTSLTQFGFELVSPDSENFFNVWVQYDGVKKVIEVYIAQQANKTDATPPRPATPILTSNLELRGVVNQYSYFGFSASTSNAIELNCVLRWNLTVEYYYKDDKLLLTIGLAVGIPTVIVLAAVVVLGYYLRKRVLSRSNTSIRGALQSLPGTPREFQFKDLNKATNSFDEKNKLGQGGYGVVYRGHLANENLEVAVKKFSREALKGQDDFLAELTIINRLRHKHLVPLLGWCHKNGKLLLVYDYMPNGSLDKHLFGELADSKPLGWSVCQKIISGVAFALHYLHVEYDQRVVHRDLKASNIMLDTDFNAKLGDFGLARALDNSKTSYIEPNGGIKGTAGYIAPECVLTHKATEQSDVYAFGAVLLEVVCGLRPGTQIGEFNLLVDWVWSLHREGRLLEAVDTRPMEDYVAEEAQRILLLGLACSHPKASDRPKIQEIVQILSGSAPGPFVPPFKPHLVWLSVPEGEEDVSNTTTTETSLVTTSHYGSCWSSLAVNPENHEENNDKFNTI